MLIKQTCNIVSDTKWQIRTFLVNSAKLSQKVIFDSVFAAWHRKCTYVQRLTFVKLILINLTLKEKCHK